MSNRRKTLTARNGAPAALRREADGSLTVVWTEGRPEATLITADALEGLIGTLNDAVKNAAPERRSILGRIGGWHK